MAPADSAALSQPLKLSGAQLARADPAGRPCAEVAGPELLEFIRRRSKSKDLLALVIWAELAGANVHQAPDLGRDGYIAKPIAGEEPESAMSVALWKRQKGQLQE